MNLVEISEETHPRVNRLLFRSRGLLLVTGKTTAAKLLRGLHSGRCLSILFVLFVTY